MIKPEQVQPIHNRPEWDEYFMRIATITAERSTCPRLQVGALAVNADHHVLAGGYNGAPRGLSHCVDVGCFLDAAGSCRRAIHAEMNVITQAARIGVSLLGATLYLTNRPCVRCSGPIIQVGIQRVVYLGEYTTDEAEKEVISRFAQADIHVVTFEQSSGLRWSHGPTGSYPSTASPKTTPIIASRIPHSKGPNYEDQE